MRRTRSLAAALAFSAALAPAALHAAQPKPATKAAVPKADPRLDRLKTEAGAEVESMRTRASRRAPRCRR